MDRSREILSLRVQAQRGSHHAAPPSGYELLYQPEVVRLYTSLLRESKNASVLEAAAGAIQNLCAGRWTVSDRDGAPVPTRLPFTTDQRRAVKPQTLTN